MSHPIHTSEAIKRFLASNEAKKVGLSHYKMSNSNRYFQKVVSSYNQIEEDRLKEMVNSKERLRRFLKYRWFEKRIALKDMGGWPYIGDLPREWCKGSIVNVAHQISIHKDMKCKSIRKIENMLIIIDDILDFFPPILVQGGEIRKERGLLSLPFDVDDGSHRCIAAVLSKRRIIKAYVGVM